MKTMTATRYIITLCVVGLTVAGIATLSHAARSGDEKKLSAVEKTAVQRVTAYFNKLRNIQGEFIQSGPGNFLTHGRFYLSKPGKLRFEYAPPNPILVVADGSYVIVKDRKLETADHYPISVTPLKLVLANKVDLLNEAKIIKVHQDAKKLAVTLEDKSVLIPGRLVLEFNNKTMELLQWIIIDGQGQSTTIAMRNVVKGVKPDPALFKVRVRNRIESDEF